MCQQPCEIIDERGFKGATNTRDVNSLNKFIPRAINSLQKKTIHWKLLIFQEKNFNLNWESNPEPLAL